MTIIPDLGHVLSDPILASRFAILIGGILVILAVVPSISVVIFKTSEIKLSNVQSRKLMVIGLFVILLGIIGSLLIPNTSPRINVFVDPPTVTINPERIESVLLTANASDPDENNIIKNYLSLYEYPLLYKFSYQGPGTNNKSTVVQGFSELNKTLLPINLRDEGQNVITVTVIDRPEEDKNAKKAVGEKLLLVIPANEPPIIENIELSEPSPQPVNSKIMIRVTAKDPERDKILYKFLKWSDDTDDFTEAIGTNNWSANKEIIWKTEESDVGENFIKICVGDITHLDGKNCTCETYPDMPYMIIE